MNYKIESITSLVVAILVTILLLTSCVREIPYDDSAQRELMPIDTVYNF